MAGSPQRERLSVNDKYVINIGPGTVIGARAYGPGAHAVGSVTVTPRKKKPVNQGRLCEGSGLAPIPSRVAHFHEGVEVSQEESDRLYREDNIWTEPKVLEDPTSDSYSCQFCQGHMTDKDRPTMLPHMRDYSLVLR